MSSHTLQLHRKRVVAPGHLGQKVVLRLWQQQLGVRYVQRVARGTPAAQAQKRERWGATDAAAELCQQSCRHTAAQPLANDLHDSGEGHKASSTRSQCRACSNFSCEASQPYWLAIVYKLACAAVIPPPWATTHPHLRKGHSKIAHAPGWVTPEDDPIDTCRSRRPAPPLRAPDEPPPALAGSCCGNCINVTFWICMNLSCASAGSSKKSGTNPKLRL